MTLTLAFTGGPLPLGVLWVWSPHCADPAASGVFTMTVDGQSSSLPQPALSCSPDLGGHSSLSLAFVDPANTNIEVGHGRHRRRSRILDGQRRWGGPGER